MHADTVHTKLLFGTEEFEERVKSKFQLTNSKSLYLHLFRVTDVRKRSCVSYKGSSSVIKFVKTLGNYGKLFAIQIIGMQ